MNIRHASTLAMVGWYLMVPPARHGQIASDAPMAIWAQIDSFDSADECRKAADDFIKSIRKRFGEDSGRYRAAISFECIATDDPRLKEH